MEGTPQQIEIIDSKERLKKLEESGKYLFHGSPISVEKLEPRQAHNLINGERMPDGEPAVFAADRVEPAIFRSIFHDLHFKELQGDFKMGFATSESGREFAHANAAAIDVCSGKPGFVYVFDRGDFTYTGEGEWKSTTPVTPVAVFNSTLDCIGLKIFDTQEEGEASIAQE